jgi:hypothetical protein
MFFFRPGSNFCTLRNPRIAYSSKDFAAFRHPAIYQPST